ncbi:hypothetical protein DFA_03429 [Cavenderia fasciculata]|uniref:F-box domain-containing protein n=1 Tax=Cavenderia fasciculata TaxID=261658 RepID=F4PHJ7_CACFS|nr:uncharacterized protein DFA_03429 [Cavenderia fasciculata]EGG25181.1 hypothetical protein DFA_03429 [Cavenderia fasciculata]|eukprot:XP_004363032.1 hypothetical protein DFA_03429 [Cavenderia fasciculata]
MKSLKSLYFSLTTSNKKLNENTVSNLDQDDHQDQEDGSGGDGSEHTNTSKNYSKSSRSRYKKGHERTLSGNEINVEELVYREEERKRLEILNQEEEENRLSVLPWIIQCYIIELFMHAPSEVRTDRLGKITFNKLNTRNPLIYVCRKWFGQCSKIFQRDGAIPFRPTMSVTEFSTHFASVNCLANHINTLVLTNEYEPPVQPRAKFFNPQRRTSRTDYLSRTGPKDGDFYAKVRHLVIEENESVISDMMCNTLVVLFGTKDIWIQSITLYSSLYVPMVAPYLGSVQSLTITLTTLSCQHTLLEALQIAESLTHLTVIVDMGGQLSSDFFLQLPTTLRSLQVQTTSRHRTNYLMNSLDLCNFVQFSRYPNLNRLSLSPKVVFDPSNLITHLNKDTTQITDLSEFMLEFTPEVHSLLKTQPKITHFNIFVSTNSIADSSVDILNNNSTNHHFTISSMPTVSCFEPITIHDKIQTLKIVSFGLSDESKLIVSNILDSLHNHRDLYSLYLEVGQINESILNSLVRLLDKNRSITRLYLLPKGASDDIPLTGFFNQLPRDHLLNLLQIIATTKTINTVIMPSNLISHKDPINNELPKQFDFVNSFWFTVLIRYK